MADISLIQDDASDDCDEGVFEQGDGTSGEQTDDNLFSPFAHLQKYALSENVWDRQMVTGVLKDLFKNGPARALVNDLPDIMNLISKLADEDESMVRIYFFEQIPNLAMVALDCAEQIPELSNILNDHLIPMIVRNLGDNDNQVRKTAQSTLFVLIENGLITPQQAEVQVCPTVLALSNVESLMDYHTGIVTLMSKLAPFLGSEITERMFLVRFSELCTNDMFYVRKVCASHFGDFCAVVGKEAYEQTLLPCYLSLCSDEIWGVRKACAEVATSVSCPCPAVKRRTVLAPVFVKLLEDQSRWVRTSAFQTLGPFISTFAEPSISNLAYNSLGELVVVNNDGIEFRINPTYSESIFCQFQERFSLMEPERDDRNLFDDISDSHEVKIDNVALELIIGTDDVKSDGCAVQPKLENNASEYITDSNNDLEQSALTVDLTLSGNNEKISTDLLMNTHTVENKNINAELPRNFIDGSSSFKDVAISSKTLRKSQNAASVSHSGKRITKSFTSYGSCDKTDKIANGSGDMCSLNFLMDNSYYVLNEYSTCPVFKERSLEDSEKQYNSFNYWYIKPELPLDELIVDLNRASSGTVEDKLLEHFIVMEHCGDKISIDAKNSESSQMSSISVPEDTRSDLKHCNNSKTKEADPPQHIVPQQLIDHYISMTDSNLADNTDKDLAYHCAYSLPAVAQTLGRNNWHLLKSTAEILAGNVHYKVRKTVASSLHELAIILGSELATSTLMPIFDDFIKDLDEVRIGILKHLAHFLGLIAQSKRNLYLSKLAEFLPAKNMNRSNWRFRKELAEQLFDVVSLFCSGDVSKYISNIAQELLCDKVAAVRESALLLVTELIRYVSKEKKLTSHLLIKLAEKFAHSTNWKRRQTFSLLCANFLRSNVMDLEQFASDVMPHLLDLSWDPVPNVRLVVGRTISEQIATNRYFFDIHSQHYDSIHSVLRRLQSDKDRDVRHSAVMSKLSAVY